MIVLSKEKINEILDIWFEFNKNNKLVMGVSRKGLEDIKETIEALQQETEDWKAEINKQGKVIISLGVKNEQLKAALKQAKEILKECYEYLQDDECCCVYDDEYGQQCRSCYFREKTSKAIEAIDKLGVGE